MAEQNYRALATEVLELGEQLFELALSTPSPSSGSTTIEASEKYDLAEAVQTVEPALDATKGDAGDLRVAADEFFMALRLLFGLPQP